jgi:hypothetical protein
MITIWTKLKAPTVIEIGGRHEGLFEAVACLRAAGYHVPMIGSRLPESFIVCDQDGKSIVYRLVMISGVYRRSGEA